MRILLVAQQLSGKDGWGTATRNTALGLQARGHDVHALVQTLDASAAIDQDDLLPPPLAMLGNPFAGFRVAGALRRAMQKVQPDLVHVLVEPYALAVPGARLPVPWVMSAFGTYTIAPLGDWKTRGRLLRAYRQMSGLLACSRYTYSRVEAELRQRDPALADAVAAKTSFFRLGIQPPATASAKPESDRKELLFVGGVKPRKGIHELLDACARFRAKTGTPFRLQIVGDCPDNSYTAAAKAKVHALGLDDCLVFRGHVSAAELEEAYAGADAFLMLSRSHGMHFEGFGLVFLEANARGIPVIGPDDSGCKEAIDEGKSGYAVNPDDPDIVASRIQQILEGALRAEDCRAWAAQHTVARQAEETEAGYIAALGGGHSGQKR
jgi:glycosyltransferase involved in cell wall biosynthesis